MPGHRDTDYNVAFELAPVQAIELAPLPVFDKSVKSLSRVPSRPRRIFQSRSANDLRPAPPRIEVSLDVGGFDIDFVKAKHDER